MFLLPDCPGVLDSSRLQLLQNAAASLDTSHPSRQLCTRSLLITELHRLFPQGFKTLNSLASRYVGYDSRALLHAGLPLFFNIPGLRLAQKGAPAFRAFAPRLWNGKSVAGLRCLLL